MVVVLVEEVTVVAEAAPVPVVVTVVVSLLDVGVKLITAAIEEIVVLMVVVLRGFT